MLSSRFARAWARELDRREREMRLGTRPNAGAANVRAADYSGLSGRTIKNPRKR